MQSNKKIQEFSVQIRRNNLQQKMGSLRSMCFLQEPSKAIENKQELLHTLVNDQESLKKKFTQLKILSWDPNTAQQLVRLGIIQRVFYLFINQEISDHDYNDILTILINICAQTTPQIPNQAMHKVAMSIQQLKKQASSLWFLANIIYNKSQYSQAVANQLINSCSVVNFMEARLENKFETEDDIIVFNFFCCSFFCVSYVLDHAIFLRLLSVIENIQKFKNIAQENFWYFSEALVDHGPHIGKNDYEILAHPLFQKFHELCKKKKTKFIKNYLKMLIGFTANDKLAYEKMLKYQLFTDLNYCLQNRHPEVKKLCSKIGINMFRYHREKIDFENIHFFSELSYQFANYEKYDLLTQIETIRYGKYFFQVLIDNQLSTETTNKFIKDLVQGKAIQSLSILITTSNGNIQMLIQSLKLLLIFMTIDQQGQIPKKCSESGVPEYLSSITINNQELYKLVGKFLNYFTQTM